MKSHEGFRLISNSVTLNDLERRNDMCYLCSMNYLRLEWVEDVFAPSIQTSLAVASVISALTEIENANNHINLLACSAVLFLSSFRDQIT